MNDVSAELIVGETDLKDREKYLKLFEDGDLTALVNHEILATGVDANLLGKAMLKQLNR